MGVSVECIAMLEHMNKPAFISNNAEVLHANKAAIALGITQGVPLTNLLWDAKCDVLTKEIRNVYYTITSSPIGAYKLCVLEQSLQEQQLQSLLRAAQHLRAPLASLTSSVNSIMMQTRLSKDPDAVSVMQKATKQLFTLQRTVRNMSDVKEYFTKRHAKLENINVFQFIRELCEKLCASFENSNVTIAYDVTNEDVYCNVDTQLLERAFYNMISNSLKADSTGIQISFKKAGTQLQLTVSDNGRGMTAEEKAGILSKFTTEPTLNFENRGLGLGMVIIHAAAIAHDGTVLITDAEPRGCKITLTLQISKDNTPVLKQRPVLINVDPMGGVDSLMIELADFLPPEIF